MRQLESENRHLKLQLKEDSNKSHSQPSCDDSIASSPLPSESLDLDINLPANLGRWVPENEQKLDFPEAISSSNFYFYGLFE